jgi:hypothetical protein
LRSKTWPRVRTARSLSRPPPSSARSRAHASAVSEAPNRRAESTSRITSHSSRLSYIRVPQLRRLSGDPRKC